MLFPALAKDGIHQIEQIAPATFRIDEKGIVNCYLLLGKEKALLIDCGVGIGNILETVQEITDLPVVLALTHRHCDHDGGRSFFKEYYVNENDKGSAYALLSSWLLRKVLLKFNKAGKIPLSKGKFHSKPRFFKNFEIELGDRLVTSLLIPGHTKGSVVYLDKTGGLMFTGDDVNPYLFLQLPGCTNVSKWLPGAKKVLELSKTYIPYIGHGNGKMSKDDIEKIIKVGEDLLAEKRRFKGGMIRYPNPEAPYQIFITKGRIK